MTVGDFLAEDVHAVEVYGIDARGGTQAPVKPWLLGTFCGTGTRIGPFRRPEAALGQRPRDLELQLDNYARVVVIWLKRRRD